MNPSVETVTQEDRKVAYSSFVLSELNREIEDKKQMLNLIQRDLSEASIQLKFSKLYPDLMEELLKDD